MAALWGSNGGGGVRRGASFGLVGNGLSSPAANVPDAVHPLVLFFGCLGGDAVEGVVALHHPPVSLRLARFYHLVFVVGNEELKAVLRVWIRQRIKKKKKCLLPWQGSSHSHQQAALYLQVSCPPPL